MHQELNVKVLLIAAHGSRKKESNLEVAQLSQNLATRLKDSFDHVTYGFLQFADPVLETRLDELAKDGAEQVVVFPFFIGSGSHIKEDIPMLVDQAAKKHSQVRFVLTCHLGKLKAVEEIIAHEADLALNTGELDAQAPDTKGVGQ